MLAMVAQDDPAEVHGDRQPDHPPSSCGDQRLRSAKVITLIRIRVASRPTIKGTVAMNSSYWKHDDPRGIQHAGEERANDPASEASGRSPATAGLIER